MLLKERLFQIHQIPLDLVHHVRLHPVVKESPLQRHQDACHRPAWVQEGMRAIPESSREHTTQLTLLV